MNDKSWKRNNAHLRKERINDLGSFGMKKTRIVNSKKNYTRKKKNGRSDNC